MKLSFKSAFLSIRAFPEVELPDFTIITGINGTGKTHLLKGIDAGNIRSDIAPNPNNDIRFFDWATIVPNETGEFQGANIFSERDQILQFTKDARTGHVEQINQWAAHYGVFEHNGNPIAKSFYHLQREDMDELITEESLRDNAWQALSQIHQTALNAVRKKVGGGTPLRMQIDELAGSLGSELLTIGVRDLEGRHIRWGEADVFRQSFAQLFMSYFELRKHNRLNRMDEQEGREPSSPPLSEEEFIEKYGEPPWDFVNRILKEARLDFEIDHPEGNTTTKFAPTLTKTTTGVELKFNELSSGERVLMSFAFCLYYSLDTRQDYNRPKLLLFDEIDAPLHPSMSRQLLDTIKNSLVTNLNVKVVMTTHAPATVAVAPEDSIYVMKAGEPGLHKVGKRQAISILTAEIPTLSIDYTGRRQVFVESGYDAQRYEKLYQILGGKLASERSLTFIQVGNKNKSGEDGGGCDQVKRFVDEMANSGNDTAYGLIDWDLKSASSERVKVLAEGRRYAIENCLLDPLLVGALLARTDRESFTRLGIPPVSGFTGFMDISESDTQKIIDCIEREILRMPATEEFGDRIQVTYLGGQTAMTSKAYLELQGHELERRVKDSFHPLRRYKNQNELLMNVIDPVLFEIPDLTPSELLAAFEQILNDQPAA